MYLFVGRWLAAFLKLVARASPPGIYTRIVMYTGTHVYSTISYVVDTMAIIPDTVFTVDTQSHIWCHGVR